MARVPYVSPEELEPRFQELLKRPINLFRALSNSPVAFSHFHPFGEWIRWECELDGRLRELVILQVGYITRSDYEFSHHVEISRNFGVTDEDIGGIIRFNKGEASGLSALDDLALSATTQLTEERRIAQDTWDALAEHFDRGRLVDLVLVISFYNLVVRVLGGLQIDVEPDYQKYLDQFPYQ